METDQKIIKELQSALRAALDWIDDVPDGAITDEQRSKMRGFDRDWAGDLLRDVETIRRDIEEAAQ